MSFDIKKLETLKEKLINCKDFREAFNYFFDLTENKQFIDMGRQVKYPALKQVLEKVGQQTIGNSNAKPTRFLIIRMKKNYFYHGAYFLDNRMVNYFYFKDIDMGMIAVASPTAINEVLFARFSITRLLSDLSAFTEPSLN